MIAPLLAELLTRWLENGQADEATARKREEARSRRELADKILTGLDLKGRRECYYVWLNLPPDIDDAKLTMAASPTGGDRQPVPRIQDRPGPDHQRTTAVPGHAV